MMSASVSNETDSGDGVMNTESPDNDSPVVSRTRSGRRLRTPAAKTPVRRTRKSVVREDPAENTESQQDTQSEETTGNRKGEESIPVTETDVSAAAAEISLKVSDQTSEKENVLNSTEMGSNEKAEKKAKKRTQSESSEKKGHMVPLGKPKSGRVWKDRKKQRFSALLRDKPLCTSWQKKMEAKREKQLMKQFQQQLNEEQARQKEEKKKRREEHLRRRAENERKAEIVQVIKNTAKIKRMKKKQLRKIEKRDTLSMVQKTPPKVKKSTEKTQSL